MIEKIKNIIHLSRRETPLPSQAEELETEQLNNLRMNADVEPPINKKVQFNLPPHHVNKNSTAWRKMPRAIRESTARRKWENAKYHRRKKNSPLNDKDIRRMVLDGTIPSGVSDSGATSTAGRPQDPFIKSNIPSSKVFHLPTGGTARASRTAKLHHNLREPARTVDIVPSLTDNTLISTGKFADANYFTVYDDKEVNIYDGKTTKIYITEEAVLRGYRCPDSKLWRIPLTDTVTNQNTQTVLLNSPDGRQSLNSMYHVPSTEDIMSKLNILLDQRPDPREAINNVYDMPSIEPAIRYLHAAAGFPTKSTWLKAIRNDNYMSWPLITVKNVNKFFPESEETQQGHMKCQRQGVRSTKVKVKIEPGTESESEEEDEEVNQLSEENDIMVAIYQANNAMHSGPQDPFIKSNIPSSKVFHLPTGGTARASRTAKLHHNLREPARTVDIVPSLTDNTLISTGKFADANYFTVYDDKEVNIYDGKTTKIYITEEAVLRGYRCPDSKLWRIPLTDTVTNQNTQTVLLNSPDGRQSLNSMYHVPSTEDIMSKLNILLDQRPDPREAINNVYDMPSIEPAIRYLHAAAGFPTKSTWLKAIRNDNYMSWPLITVKNVNKFFPESEETQQGHMKCQRQGVRSARIKSYCKPFVMVN